MKNYTDEQYAEMAVLANEQGKILEVVDGELVLVDPTPPTLEELKEAKLQEIRQAFDNEENSGYVGSSLGFKADATRKSKADIDGLIQAMDAMGMDDVTFRDHDNQMHTLTLAQMKTLQLEVIQKGLWNYSTKWTLEGVIEASTTKAEIEAIVWPKQ